MFFSKACEYGIRATIFLAKTGMKGKRSSPKDVAQAVDSPEAFTAKILQQLSRSNLISSRKGPNGGFEITSDVLEKLRLIDVVNVIDGDEIFTACILGLNTCNHERPCPVHFEMVKIRKDIRELMETTLIKDLAKKIQEDQIAYLKIEK